MSGNRTPLSGLAVAGWLFADLLAALVLVLLGTRMTAHPPVRPSPSPSLSLSPTAFPSPTPPAEPSPTIGRRPVGLSNDPVTAVVTVSDERSLRRELRESFDDELSGRRAGLVLTFGAGDSAQGTALANRVNSTLRAMYPAVFRGAVTRDFHDSGLTWGHAEVEIYLFTGD